MLATYRGQPFDGSPLTWSLFFARQPEPDLEFTEEELEQTAHIRPSTPMKSPKKSGGSPLLWILLLVLIGGGAYVAMEPEMVMDWVGPLLGETQAPSHPPLAMKPAQPKPVPIPQPSQPTTTPTAPAAAPAQAPQAAASGAEPARVLQPAQPDMPNMPTSSSPVPPAPPTVESAVPMFGEGQRVTVLPNPAAPREKVSLMQDAEGTKPGPAIPPGTAFTILDGDLQDRGWVYYVRSDYGTKGWLDEAQLKAKH